MRRYGYTGYGGTTNDYTSKEQPLAFRPVPPRNTDVRWHTPADVQPRRPSKTFLERPLSGPETEGGVFDTNAFLDALFDRMQRELRAYNVFDPLRYGAFKTLPFSIGTTDQLVLDKATDIRIYLFIINTHPLNDLFIAFQVPATAVAGVPISPARGFYEFINPVPQDAIHIVASAAGTTGVLVYSERDPAVLNRQPGPV
jgi:hypothetical protein